MASSAFAGQMVEFFAGGEIQPVKGAERWRIIRVAWRPSCVAAGIPLDGMDAYISNTLRWAGIVEQRGAIEVATALCFLSLVVWTSTVAAGAAVQKAEHEIAGAPVGIMDMTIVIGGRTGACDAAGLPRFIEAIRARWMPGSCGW